MLAVRKDELGELRKAIPLRVGMQVRRRHGAGLLQMSA